MTYKSSPLFSYSKSKFEKIDNIPFGIYDDRYMHYN